MFRITASVGLRWCNEMEIEVYASGSETVTLYHGSALVYCNSVATGGLDYGKLQQACPGAYAFCTSIRRKIAKGYAFMNPLVVQEGHTPAVLKFDVFLGTLQDLQASKLAAWVEEDQAYELHPESFYRINIEMRNVSVEEVTGPLSFDEP